MIISGSGNDLEATCTNKYLIPKDPYNFFAISINYYIPFDFTLNIIAQNDQDKWGNDDDYNELITILNL